MVEAHENVQSNRLRWLGILLWLMPVAFLLEWLDGLPKREACFPPTITSVKESKTASLADLLRCEIVILQHSL